MCQSCVQNLTRTRQLLPFVLGDNRWTVALHFTNVGAAVGSSAPAVPGELERTLPTNASALFELLDRNSFLRLMQATRAYEVILGLCTTIYADNRYHRY